MKTRKLLVNLSLALCLVIVFANVAFASPSTVGTSQYYLEFEEEDYNTNQFVYDFTTIAHLKDNNDEIIDASICYKLTNNDGEVFYSANGFFYTEYVFEAWGGVVEAQTYYNGVLITADVPVYFTLIQVAP